MKFVRVVPYGIDTTAESALDKLVLIPLKSIERIRFKDRKATFYENIEFIDGKCVGANPYTKTCEFTIVETHDGVYECFDVNEIAPELEDCIVEY